MTFKRRFALCNLLTLIVAAVLALYGCSGIDVSNKDGVVQVDSTAVTARDIEVAKQMNAPERVQESLEDGEWLYVSDREFVRYAELAIDYMKNEHNVDCRAKWTEIPWVLKSEAEVTLVVLDGIYEGQEVKVTVSASEPRSFSDTWAAIEQSSTFDELVLGALSQAFNGIPRESWTYEAKIDVYQTNHERVAGDVDIYLSSSVVGTQEQFDEVLSDLEDSLKDSGAQIAYYLVVPSSVPPEGELTVPFGLEAAKKDGDAVLFRASGEVGVDE